MTPEPDRFGKALAFAWDVVIYIAFFTAGVLYAGGPAW